MRRTKQRPSRKNITLRQFLFGDFDYDGILNIDDPRPFNKKIKRYPQERKKGIPPSFYHHPQYGGFETRFSTALKNLEKESRKRAKKLTRIIRKNPGSVGRVKTIPSTIVKLQKRGMRHVNDLAAMTIYVDKRSDVFKKAAEIRKKYPTVRGESDNFYRHPKDGYYAYHLLVRGRDGIPVEIQIKTRKMAALHGKMHSSYKKGQSRKRYRKIARKLYQQGY